MARRRVNLRDFLLLLRESNKQAPRRCFREGLVLILRRSVFYCGVWPGGWFTWCLARRVVHVVFGQAGGSRARDPSLSVAGSFKAAALFLC